MQISPTFRLAAVAFIFSIALTLSPTTATAQQPGGGARPATGVGMDTVRIELLRQTVPVIGRFVAQQSGVVAARIAGPVQEYMVKVGDRVEKGDLMVKMVDEAIQWERTRRAAVVSSERAGLETSRASLRLLEQELARLDALRESPAFSQARYDDKLQETVRARSEIAQQTAELRSAEADFTLATIGLKNTEIMAPYDGAVIQRHSETGAWLREGDPVVTLLDYKNLEIEADVPANRISSLKTGLLVSARMETGDVLQAEVRAVIPDENPRTRTRRVRFVAVFDGENQSSAANQSVTVQIPAGEARDVITVDKDAILNQGGRQVVVVNDAGKADFRSVQLGEATGSRFVVLEGLEEGEQVVIRGNERLRPGQAIRDMAAPPPEPAANDAASKDEEQPS